ncbi:MAG: GNAT family N-acetyltransferase [Anaerolineae bacterium]
MERDIVVDVVIRPARPDDAEAIGNLWADLVAYHHALDAALPAAAPDGPSRYARAIEDHLRSSTTRVLVAEYDGQVVGYILGVVADMVSSFFTHEATGFIADLFVMPEHRRRSVGRHLVVAMAEWFASCGMRQYEWHAAAHNEEALAFWNSLGGAPVLVRMRATGPLEER